MPRLTTSLLSLLWTGADRALATRSARPNLRPSKILFPKVLLIALALGGPSSLSVADSTETPVGDFIKASDIVTYGNARRLSLRSRVALMVDEREQTVLFDRQADRQRPIASLTKLMTALVIAEAGLPLDEPIEITRHDRDLLRGTRSRLRFGGIFTRGDLLQAALGASDNRAAAALARTFPRGTSAFIAAMNQKARALGMQHTTFADASGLDKRNVSTARDLVLLMSAVREFPLLRNMSTTTNFAVRDLASGREERFVNTNRFVRGRGWDIELSKTGYTTDAGYCLVMYTQIGSRPVTLVLLDSWGKLSKYGDANRLRDWLVQTEERVGRTVATRANAG